METINLILTSGLVAGVISAIISFLVSIYLKKIDFKNEYYKQILQKRLSSYEFIETQIKLLKSITLNENDRPYHTIFAYGLDKLIEYQLNFHLALLNSLWIDENTLQELENFNELFYSISNKAEQKSREEIIELGKDYYPKISQARIRLEDATKNGLYNLHDMKRAFKSRNDKFLSRTLRKV